MSADALLSRLEAAKHLGVSVGDFDRHVLPGLRALGVAGAHFTDADLEAWIDAHRTPGRLYALEAEGLERVKLGYTSKPIEERIASLQTGSAVPLRLLAVRAAHPQAERVLHLRFAHLRILGEWFSLTDELRSHLRRTRWT